MFKEKSCAAPQNFEDLLGLEKKLLRERTKIDSVEPVYSFYFNGLKLYCFHSANFLFFKTGVRQESNKWKFHLGTQREYFPIAVPCIFSSLLEMVATNRIEGFKVFLPSVILSGNVDSIYNYRFAFLKQITIYLPYDMSPQNISDYLALTSATKRNLVKNKIEPARQTLPGNLIVAEGVLNRYISYRCDRDVFGNYVPADETNDYTLGNPDPFLAFKQKHKKYCFIQ